VKWFSKSELRVISAMLAFVVLIGSMPLTAGIAIASRPKQPTFTLNICQPLQAAINGIASPIARPATSPPRVILHEDGKTPASPPEPLADLSIAPESPPPKAPF